MVKAVLAGLLVVALGLMWTDRSTVVDAYRSSEESTPLRLSGVDLDVATTPIEPSPYRRPAAPQTLAVPQPVGLGVGAEPPEVDEPTLSGGEARLLGTVVGPDGPVSGAVVRIERHSDEGVAAMDAITGDDGGWAIAPLAGGRYRVRAWLPGLLTMGRSEVRFVAEDEVATFDFSLWGIDPTPVVELVDGGPLYDGLASPVALVAGWRSVDADGLVVTNPLVGAPITVESTAQVEVLSAQPLLTEASGVALVDLRCVPTPSVDASGPGAAGTLIARLGTIEATFVLPGCQPVPEPDPAPGPADAPTTDDPTTDDPTTDDPTTDDPVTDDEADIDG
ncbi:MAG: carboxypeptidase-like regulatory domain-containing protein [Actinomycetota bacterium]